MTAAQLNDVSFSYEGTDKLILDHASFTLNYGEIALLSGYSGEGKSTILSLLCSIIPNITPGNLTGSVFINGEDIAGKKMSEVSRNVAVVMQNAESQIIQSEVEDEIAFGCENFNFPVDEIRKCVDDSAKMMALDPLWKTRTLSGGQKQRLMTAAAFATRQKILMLDEPLANLDTAGGELLMRRLRELADTGSAILIIEHRLDMVLPYADAVWSVTGGKIVPVSDARSQAAPIIDKCRPSSSTEVLLSLENIGFRASGREILHDISLDVYKGERLLILGENGCGKTTLLRLIARLNKSTAGQITQYIDAGLKQSQRGSREWFRVVGVVYQNPNYQLFMPTVFEEIAYGAPSNEYAEEILEMFRLQELRDRHPQSLSEGQKRRVSIAAVAATRPRLLLLDEPTVGQDRDGLERLMEILGALHEKTGSTMISVTHDKRCALALCDRAVLIENGTIKRCGGKDLTREFFNIEK